MHIIRILERKYKEIGAEEIFEEIMTENFKLLINTKLQIKEIENNKKDKYQKIKSTPSKHLPSHKVIKLMAKLKTK